MEILTSLVMLLGGLTVLLAGVGMLRLPDIFTRMQAATKAGTVGSSLLMLAVALHFAELEVVAGALLVIFFLVLTAPVAAHMIARIAYLSGVPLWTGTVRDELAEDLRREGRAKRTEERPPPRP